MTPLLTARGLHLAGRLEAIDLDFLPGQMVAVIGPNGSGKTSLLRALADIERTEGEVLVNGEVLAGIPPARRQKLLSFLPASREVSWPIPAEDVIALGSCRENREGVQRVIEALELVELARRPVDRLSTGERARVLLARALVSSPAALLLDEPLSNLDPYHVLRTLAVIRSAVSDGAGAIVSVHDLGLLDCFDRALLMHEGQVVGDRRPNELIGSPEFASSFRVEPTSGGWRVVA